ncbi:Uncharacterised protein [Burkholderia pseudomallei]|nr:Uncharacterised protein [Burkholderia pseudomallei]CAJ9990891.1 Uncharacterised protein [Burkholderia pseudomallei]
MSKPFRPYGKLPEDAEGAVQPLVIEKSPAVVEVPSLNKIFDFGFLFNITSVELARKVSMVLGKEFAKFARNTAGERMRFFARLFEHIASDEKLLAALRAGGNMGRLGDRASWEACLNSWFEAGVESYGPDRLTTLGEMVNGLRRVYKALERKGLAPRVAFPEMPKNYHVGRGTRPSLIEVKKREEMFVDVVQLVKERAVELGVPEDAMDIRYLRELGDRVPPELLGSRDAFVTAMREVNSELLDNVRKLAEAAFLQGYADFQEGKRLISTANVEDVNRINELMLAYEAGTEFSNLKAQLWNLLIEKEPEETLATLLAYLDRHNNGVPLIGMRREKATNVFVNKLYRHVGGVARLIKLLGCDANTIAAAMLVYMVDSGANPSVAAELSFDCMQPADDQKKVVIDSLKGRSDWRVIVRDFERMEPGIAATVPDIIDKTIEMTAKMRAGFPDLNPYLFIFRWYEIPSVASIEFLSNRLKYLVRDAGLSEGLYRLDSIRQSFLMEFALEADGNKRLAEIVAQHNKPHGTTINTYTDRWPIRILLSRKIIEYQKLLEYDFLFNGVGLEEAWGVSKEAAARILEKAERTGYGIRCRNSKWRPNATANHEDDCPEAGAPCLDCGAKLFVVDEEAIRDIVREKQTLEAEQPEQEANSSPRWESEGLPLLAFYIAVIEKLKRSPFAGLLKRILDEEKGERDGERNTERCQK